MDPSCLVPTQGSLTREEIVQEAVLDVDNCLEEGIFVWNRPSWTYRLLPGAQHDLDVYKAATFCYLLHVTSAATTVLKESRHAEGPKMDGNIFDSGHQPKALIDHL